ncbi:unnamed protein product [Lepeophtheirus salmonis]|uniref:(salmon louse) hypothetical protein n=1 Tax=Lepeophtheirus salmonis TaxID=72036 RepID=A0A7R8H2M8_LEPSM|nr:unnamed protein product [Lepeophtheirus salmonis]CAF2817712.1 unnamed protein product [Lepeophtheirus salmonis]
MESRVVGEDDEGVGGSVGGDVGLVGSRLVGSEGGVSWEFVGSGLCSGGAGVGGVLESVGLPGSSQYRPWEGSEVLLRGGLGYYGRNVDERLPSFESQFQELPLGYSPEGPYAYPRHGPGCARHHTSLRKRRAQGMYSKAAAVEAGGESRQPSLATSSSLDTHPTLVSQLRKKCRTGSLEESASESSSLQDTPGQVAAISSTDPSPESLSTQPDSFKPPTTNIINQHMIPSQPSLRQTLQPRQKENVVENVLDAKKRIIVEIKKKPKKISSSDRLICTPSRQTSIVTSGFPQSSSVSAVTGENNLWCQQGSLSQQHQSGSSNTTCTESWSSHYNLTQPTNSMPPPCAPSSQNNASIFDHHFDSFIRRPQSGSTPILLSSTHNYHEVPSPNPSAPGFIPVNGSSSSLGYNLAVNSETKPYIARNGLISPRNISIQGNSQPGCPPRPAEGLIEILPNCNKSSLTLFEGSPGHIKRTGVSPDTPFTGNPCSDAITLMPLSKHEVQKQHTTTNTTSMSTSSVISSSNDTESTYHEDYSKIEEDLTTQPKKFVELRYEFENAAKVSVQSAAIAPWSRKKKSSGCISKARPSEHNTT